MTHNSNLRILKKKNSTPLDIGYTQHGSQMFDYKGKGLVLCKKQTEVNDNYRARPPSSVPGGAHQGEPSFLDPRYFQVHTIEGASSFSD